MVAEIYAFYSELRILNQLDSFFPDRLTSTWSCTSQLALCFPIGLRELDRTVFR